MSKKNALPIMIGDVIWQYLGSGSYNDAYVAVIKTQKKVYKIPKAKISPGVFPPQEEAMDTPYRAVRLWNEVNPKFLAETYSNGWVAPFIEGENPNSQEICNAIVDLYQRTGRVLADAMSPNNFKKLKTGEIVCVDIGVALKLERELEDEKSQASLDFWDYMKKTYDRYFYENQLCPAYVPIVNMTKALLVLQHFRPDVRDVSCLKTDTQLVSKLANFYTTSTLPDNINQIFPINLNYFSKIPLLQDIVSAQNISDDHKRKLCRLYQLKEFSRAHIQLFFLLINKVSVNASDAISLLEKNNIEQADMLVRNLSKHPIIFQAISLYLEPDLKGQSLSSKQRSLAMFFKSKISSGDSLQLLFTLSQENILTQANFDQVNSHADLASLAGAVGALSQAKILTQANFDLKSSEVQDAYYIKEIKKKTDKPGIKQLVTNATSGVTKNNKVSNEEKIRKLCEIGKVIMDSCLKKESGVFGLGLFSKIGKTQSYQYAMGEVKKSLLKVLAGVLPGKIQKDDIILAKSILGEHVRRGPHIMGASSLSDSCFLKHEKYWVSCSIS